MRSFTSLVKEEMLNLEEKLKLCCAFSFLYGMFYVADEKEDEFEISTNAENIRVLEKYINIIGTKKKIDYIVKGRKISINKGVLRYFALAEIKRNVFKCEHCVQCFLRGLFVACASVNNPEKSYRIEFVFKDFDKADAIKDLFLEQGFDFKTFERNGKVVLYSKSNEAVSDVLALVGANNAAFEVINTKIMKELRNEANRISNCDSANIDKTLKANEKYLIAIKYLIDNNLLSTLSEELQLMAQMRLEYDNLTLGELGKKFSPPISKSGVFHRLEKILDFYTSHLN